MSRTDKKNRLWSLFLVAALLFISVSILFALSIDSVASEREMIKKEKNLEDVKKQIRHGKEAVKEMEGKERSILSDLDKVERDLSRVRTELRGSKKKLKKVEGEVKSTEAKLKKTKAERKRLSKMLNERLRSIYVMRSGAALGVLFSSVSTEGLGRRHKYMEVIMDSDRALIEDCERNIVAVAIEKERLKGLKAKQQKVMHAHNRRKVSVDKKKRERAALLKRTRMERSEQAKFVSELEEAAKELSDLITTLKEAAAAADTALDSSGFSAMKGSLVRPVEGRVVQQYGKVTHPKFNTVTFNNGIVIGAPLGTTVRSVYEGKVAYVGRLKGYGQVLIIEHGGGFYTLFGQLFEVLKSGGDMVAKGEEVGLVGEAGIGDAAGLYFEIRQGGVPRDPMAWLK